MRKCDAKRMILGAALVVGTGAEAGWGRVLYSGTGLPQAESNKWTYQTTPSPIPQPVVTLVPGGVEQDTTAVNATYGAWINQLDAGELDRTNGFRLTFTLKVLSEASGDPTRTGFSVSVLTNDTQQVELAFKTGSINTQNVNFNGFAATTTFDTTQKTTYDLDVLGSSYTLSTGATTLLSGNLVAYNAGDPSANPAAAFYLGRNVVAFSDNTSRASSKVQLFGVSVVPEPTALGVLPVVGMMGLRRRGR